MECITSTQLVVPAITGKNTGWIVGILSGSWMYAWLGGPSLALRTLCILVVLDWVSAFVARVYRWAKDGGEFEWDMRKSILGLCKVSLYMVFIVLSVQADLYLSTLPGGVDTHGRLREAVLAVLVGTEASSILRHIRLCDITVPQWIITLFKGLGNKKGE